MRAALFDSEHGYYRTKNPIGKDSDFITAPEISQVFGELLAAYLLQISSTKTGEISLVEMGAGRGTLLYDIVHTIRKLARKNNQLALDFLGRSKLHVIEINKALQKIQREKLADFSVSWHERFEDFLPSTRQIFFISNELFDCFPIDQFVYTDLGWFERLIDSEGKLTTGDFHPKIQIEAPFGAIFERSYAAQNFMNQLCAALKTKGGVAISFDYGYSKTEFANTLQAVKNHQKVSIETKGCDLTAHVDFGALDKIAKTHRLNSSLITQREFLLALGIEERRKNLPEENQAIDRLIAPDQMGELFKCHIIWD